MAGSCPRVEADPKVVWQGPSTRISMMEKKMRKKSNRCFLTIREREGSVSFTGPLSLTRSWRVQAAGLVSRGLSGGSVGLRAAGLLFLAFDPTSWFLGFASIRAARKGLLGTKCPALRTTVVKEGGSG